MHAATHLSQASYVANVTSYGNKKGQACMLSLAISSVSMTFPTASFKIQYANGTVATATGSSSSVSVVSEREWLNE